LSRLTAKYDPTLTLISLLVEAYGVSLESSEQTLNLPGFLFDMNHFFEALMARFLRENLPAQYTVENQFKLHGMMRYIVNPQHRRAPMPRPDYVVKEKRLVVAMLDAKYRDIWANGLPREMLYQLAMYALSQGSGGRATILYPTLGNDAKSEVIEIRELTYGGQLAQVVLRPINLIKLHELIDSKTRDSKKERLAFSNRLVFDERSGVSANN
jgi:5-methylcytosine-specific restriction enzyme subunit McrC